MLPYLCLLPWTTPCLYARIRARLLDFLCHPTAYLSIPNKRTNEQVELPTLAGKGKGKGRRRTRSKGEDGDDDDAMSEDDEDEGNEEGSEEEEEEQTGRDSGPTQGESVCLVACFQADVLKGNKASKRIHFFPSINACTRINTPPHYHNAQCRSRRTRRCGRSAP